MAEKTNPPVDESLALPLMVKPETVLFPLKFRAKDGGSSDEGE